MATLTVQLPDEKHSRLLRLARARHMTVDQLLEEVSSSVLADSDAQARFMARAKRGSAAVGVKILDKLDKAFARRS